MKYKLFLFIIGISSVSVYGQSMYPDSATVIGHSRYESATGACSGNRISVRDTYGIIYAVFCYVRGAPFADSSGIYYVFSTDNGLTWSPPENISQCDSQSSEEPNLAIDSRNHLHCVWKQFYYDTLTAYHDYDIYYSHKDSMSWTRPINISNQSLGANACYSSMAIDSRDYVHVVWDMSTGSGNWDIFYSFYNDTIWSTPYQLSNSPYDDAFPAVAIDKDDNLHATWRQRTTNGPIFYCKYNGTMWSPPEVIASILNSQSGASCVVVDSLNQPHVVFNNAIMPNDSSEIYYIYFNGSSWTAPLNLSNSIRPSYQPGLAIDSLGHLYLVWTENVTNYRTDILYRIYNGANWTSPINITQDTTGSHAPHLGNPVKQNRIDLIWSSFVAINPDRYDIVYLGLNALGISENNDLANVEDMISAAPNPFQSRLCIRIRPIAGTGNNESSIRIFDAAGRMVKGYAHLFNHQPTRLEWSGDDAAGKPLPPGVYFIHWEGGGSRATIKTVKLK